MMNTSENITQKEESLSAFVTFRIRPSALESLSTLVESTRMTRSELIRRTLAAGGVVYVGNDLISAIADCRREAAQIGNLLKMLSGELQVLADNPLLADDVKTQTLTLLGHLEKEASAIKQTRMRLIRTMESVHDRLQELGNGNF